MNGPMVTQKWQDDLQLEPTLIDCLLPKVDPTTGRVGSSTVDDFFNTKILNPTKKYHGAVSILQEKATVAEFAAHQMNQYATDCSKFVNEKITPVLKDWAKTKNAAA